MRVMFSRNSSFTVRLRQPDFINAESVRGKSVAGAVGVAVVIGVVLVFMFNGSNAMRELEIRFGS
jgi:hypothetical protein